MYSRPDFRNSVLVYIFYATIFIRYYVTDDPYILCEKKESFVKTAADA